MTMQWPAGPSDELIKLLVLYGERLDEVMYK